MPKVAWENENESTISPLPKTAGMHYIVGVVAEFRLFQVFRQLAAVDPAELAHFVAAVAFAAAEAVTVCDQFQATL